MFDISSFLATFRIRKTQAAVARTSTFTIKPGISFSFRRTRASACTRTLEGFVETDLADRFFFDAEIGTTVVTTDACRIIPRDRLGTWDTMKQRYDIIPGS